MKITVAREEFSEALKDVLKATAVKPMQPILSGIYLKAENSTLEMQATDHSVGIISKIMANVEESGETVIIGRKLFEIVQKLSGATLTITADDKNAEIKSAGAKYNLLVFDAEDFPKIQREENLLTINLEQLALKKLIRKSAFAAAEKETSRPVFSGVMFELDGEKLTLAATNTHRLAVASMPLEENYSAEKNVIPAKVLQEVSGMMGAGGVVEISFSDKKVAFTFDNLFVTTRLIADNFPPYEKLLNSDRPISAQLLKEDFFGALERVSVIAKEHNYEMVKLEFGDGVKISSSSPEIGTAEEFVTANVEGGELEIGFNYEYLLDVLKVMESEEVSISMSSNLAPLDFQEENFRYIVTPVRY